MKRKLFALLLALGAVLMPVVTADPAQSVTSDRHAAMTVAPASVTSQCPIITKSTRAQIPGYSWTVRLTIRYYKCAGGVYGYFRTISMSHDDTPYAVSNSMESNDSQYFHCGTSFACYWNGPFNLHTQWWWYWTLTRGGHYVKVSYDESDDLWHVIYQG